MLAPQVEALTQDVSDTIDAAEQDRLTTTLRALVQGFPDRP